MPGDRKTEWGAARQAFLTHVDLDEVARRIRAGTPLSRIHAELSIPSISYKRFREYVRRFVRMEKDDQPRTRPEPRQGAPAPLSSPEKALALTSSPSGSSGAAISPPVPAPSIAADEARTLAPGEPRPKRADIGFAEPGPSSVLDPDPVIDRAKKRDQYC